MDDRSRYVDPDSFERFSSYEGKEESVERVVPLTVPEAFDAWIQCCWIDPSVSTLDNGEGRGHVGHHRKVPLGITEQILAAGAPATTTSPDAICSILYQVQTYSIAPMERHLGFVRFIPDTSVPSDAPKTLVVWTYKCSPTGVCKYCCGGALWRYICSTSLRQYLNRLK